MIKHTTIFSEVTAFRRHMFSTPAWFRLCAGLSAVLILWLGFVIWPIGQLGYVIDGASGVILEVTPGTEADRAHLRAGDHITTIYGQPWHVVMAQWNVRPLVPPQGQPVSITIQRNGEFQDITLLHVAPTFRAQVAKATNSMLALICVVVGFLLGTVRRQHMAASLPVALFWLMIGTVIGCYVFAVQLSLPLQVVLQCLLVCILLPYAILVHLHYPARFVTQIHLARARLGLLAWAGLSTLAFCIVWLRFRASAAQLLPVTSGAAIIAVMLSLLATIIIFVNSYHRTHIAHLRRHIRIIMFAAIAVICLWGIFFGVAYFGDGAGLSLDQTINGVVVLIPLAYLVSDMRPDLYDLDRGLQHLVKHLLTAALLVSSVTAIMWYFGLTTTADRLWAALAIVMGYRPLLIGVQYLQLRLRSDDTNYVGLYETIGRLGQTLDEAQLIRCMQQGIFAAFGHIPIAWYHRSTEKEHVLALHSHDRMLTLPAELPPASLAKILAKNRLLQSASELMAHLSSKPVQDDEKLLVWGSDAVLWCPILHTEGHLLGLLLLGRRTNIDPYRAADIRALQRLLDAASLAFTNSATYQQRCEAEATIRELYQALQDSQDRTAAVISREIHDEVLNVNVRLNIQSLHQLLRRTKDAYLRKELELLLEGEQSTAKLLRMICEELHPTGLDDPMGLPAVLRVLIEQTCAGWAGESKLVIEREAIPISPMVQREVLRIVREAITNAIKHAQPMMITVTVCYPSLEDTQVVVVVQDDGRTGRSVELKPNNLGVRNMRERAQLIGAALSFEAIPSGGTAVRMLFRGKQEKSVA